MENHGGYKVRFQIVTTDRALSLSVYEALAQLHGHTMELAKEQSVEAFSRLNAWELDKAAIQSERVDFSQVKAAAELVGIPEWLKVDPPADRVTLTLPLPPDTVNPRRNSHWQAVARKKLEYHEAVEKILEEKQLPSFKAADYLAHFYVAGRHDRDNITAKLKLPQDALVRHGIVPNDSEKFLRLAEFPQQTVVSVRRRRAESNEEYWRRKTEALQQLRVELTIWERR